jgi:para-nitrobenzyl esterase
MFVLMNPQKPTSKSFAEMASTRFGDAAPEFLKLYPVSTDAEAIQSTQALAGDDFIAFSTWQWLDMQLQTGNAPVYQYLFEQVPKVKPGAMIGPLPAMEAGSKHAGKIEYVFEALKSQQGVPWTDDDFNVSETMANYWVNFIKTGDPDGPGMPNWPKSTNTDGYQVTHLSGTTSHAVPDSLRARYEFLDKRTPAPSPNK